MSRLDLRDVDAGYGKGRVLAGVSLVADPGAIIAVVGS
jgi:ABC-type histidine transport system ATPase subunit